MRSANLRAAASSWTARRSSVVDDAIELACTGVAHKARAALSGLSGQRHGRRCRVRVAFVAFAHPPVREPRGRPIFFTAKCHVNVHTTRAARPGSKPRDAILCVVATKHSPPQSPLQFQRQRLQHQATATTNVRKPRASTAAPAHAGQLPKHSANPRSWQLRTPAKWKCLCRVLPRRLTEIEFTE